MRAAFRFLPVFLLALAGCGKYRDFTLPLQPGGPDTQWAWRAEPKPVLSPGPAGQWDSSDVLNPSVIRRGSEYWNLFSGYDGKTWHTGLATSLDGVSWSKSAKILSPDPSTWEGDHIAANGSAIEYGNEVFYYYQAGRVLQIGLARSESIRDWRKQRAPVLESGPYGSWDERGVADPYVIRGDARFYMFYLGMDRARRQRLGVAESEDGLTWYKLRSNPILELGDYGSFDENGLGEPAVWALRGYYWMLYTGRDRKEYRRLGMARSKDGAHWEKLPFLFSGDQAWNSKVICDPAVLAGAGRVRVWFGGGDVARPDENIHGRIGAAVLEPILRN